ncbi:hypothetical protein ACQEVX_30250 [Streptomyces syringium]|uniref:hypothetical protein n=1 Tax=Streptomyces syringium TaxID=76729 RepID=UPI003D90CDDE
MTTRSLPYSRGVWLVDTQRGRVGEVMGNEGPRVQLRPPGGGREWDVDPAALREPSIDEMRQAGLTPAPPPQECV